MSSKRRRIFNISDSGLPSDIGSAACAVLEASDPAAKVSLSARIASEWVAGKVCAEWLSSPPGRPARPSKPELLAPGKMPRRRRAGTLRNRIALIHAIAHIELNAIDLAWDMVARFGKELPGAFADDWINVAAEEALHFSLLQARLEELGSSYGTLPAHDGLWQAALDTSDDVLARLAIVPLVLEARGLDVTPAMIDRADKAGDVKTAEILRRILKDEIGHVSVGARWFQKIARMRNLSPKCAFHQLVGERYSGALKEPFNKEARLAAGFPIEFWNTQPDGQKHKCQ